MASSKRRVWKPSKRAGKIPPPAPVVSRRVWKPERAPGLPVDFVPVEQVHLDKHLRSMTREDLVLRRAVRVLDLELMSFPCRESTPCVGMVVGGKAVHHYACAWWKRSQNKNKTPF